LAMGSLYLGLFCPGVTVERLSNTFLACARILFRSGLPPVISCVRASSKWQITRTEHDLFRMAAMVRQIIRRVDPRRLLLETTSKDETRCISRSGVQSRACIRRIAQGS